jgi:hypothetical protein
VARKRATPERRRRTFSGRAAWCYGNLWCRTARSGTGHRIGWLNIECQERGGGRTSLGGDLRRGGGANGLLAGRGDREQSRLADRLNDGIQCRHDGLENQRRGLQRRRDHRVQGLMRQMEIRGHSGGLGFTIGLAATTGSRTGDTMSWTGVCAASGIAVIAEETDGTRFAGGWPKSPPSAPGKTAAPAG